MTYATIRLPDGSICEGELVTTYEPQEPPAPPWQSRRSCFNCRYYAVPALALPCRHCIELAPDNDLWEPYVTPDSAP